MDAEYYRAFGERVKRRRNELHMTQDELAWRLGYKSRSSVNKIELGKAGIPQPTISKLAAALDTTETYLMGWSKEESESKSDPLVTLQRLNIQLTSEEIAHIINLRKCDPKVRAIAIKMVQDDVAQNNPQNEDTSVNFA